MGLFSFIKSELIDIVEWPEETPGILVHRFNRHDNEIKRGAKLIVRPGQTAVFVNEGKIADRFEPGTYTLETANLPILTTLLSLPYGFNSWHKAEVYFIKRTEQLDRRWGTQQPIMMRDLDFGILRIRAFELLLQIGPPIKCWSALVGTPDEFQAEDIETSYAPRFVRAVRYHLADLKYLHGPSRKLQ